jgi:glycosyl transferase, family 25
MNWKELLNQSFDKIFVITLPRAHERHRLIERELSGVNFEFFYGVDKLEFSVEDAITQGVYSPKRTKAENRYYPELSLGQVACSWSHLKIYQDIIAKGYEKVLIFEDDAVVIRENIGELQNIMSELPSDWELLYLGYRKHWNITPMVKVKQLYYRMIGALRITSWSSKMYSNYYAKPYSEHFMRAGFHDYAHAYAITLDGAQKLAKFQTPIAFSADTLLSYAVMKDVVKAYISLPKLFDQEGLTSYINSWNVEE